MRKIEQEMCEAIRERKEWRKDNTAVAHNPDSYPHEWAIYLHGHHIAYAWADCTGIIYAEPNRDTLREWPTVTTKSRLRALGVDLTQHQGKIYIDGDYVCDTV